VYPMFEPLPTSRIVNHAHNDWLELWLEGGAPFLLLAGMFVFFMAWSGVKLVHSAADDGLLLRARAAWIGLLLVMLHAVVDYALRSTANMVVFALLLAVLLGGLGKREKGGAGRA
jgi:O-antigen ligase